MARTPAMSEDEDEDEENWRLVRAPLGEAWSGRARYAAAMHFYGQGRLGAEVLEAYRVCARLDAQDPLALLSDRGIGAEWLALLRSPHPPATPQPAGEPQF